MPRATVDTRAEIRAAALELFAERGVDATSLREIAERIGITKAALYYHYASKDALLGELVDPMFAELRSWGTSSRPTVDAGDEAAVRAVIERFWELLLRNRQVMRVLIHNPAVVARADIAPRMLHWRERVDAVLVGSDAARTGCAQSSRWAASRTPSSCSRGRTWPRCAGRRSTRPCGRCGRVPEASASGSSP